MSEGTVRRAGSADLVAVAAIYAHSVRTNVATFDVEEPPLSSWQAKLDSVEVGDRFLVATAGATNLASAHASDSNLAGEGHADDQVIGFAYSGAFRSRPA